MFKVRPRFNGTPRRAWTQELISTSLVATRPACLIRRPSKTCTIRRMAHVCCKWRPDSSISRSCRSKWPPTTRSTRRWNTSTRSRQPTSISYRARRWESWRARAALRRTALWSTRPGAFSPATTKASTRNNNDIWYTYTYPSTYVYLFDDRDRFRLLSVVTLRYSHKNKELERK